MKVPVPVLLYHSVSRENENGFGYLSVSARAFEKQIRFLHDRGFKSVSLQEAVDVMNGKRKAEGRIVVITFDDGYRDIYYNAFPILQKYGFQATVFLVSDFIGGTSEWDKGISLSYPKPLLSGEEIREMAKAGVTFGSHTRTHARLISLPQEELENEIMGSKRDLEGLLQSEMKYFSYPYFAVDERVCSVVKKAGYAVACRGDHLGRENTEHYLIRTMMSNEKSLILWLKCSGWYHQLRSNRQVRVVKSLAGIAAALCGSFLQTGIDTF